MANYLEGDGRMHFNLTKICLKDNPIQEEFKKVDLGVWRIGWSGEHYKIKKF